MRRRWGTKARLRSDLDGARVSVCGTPALWPKFTSPIVPAKRLIVLDHGELQRVVGAQRGRTEKLTAVMVVFDHASVSSIGSEYGWGWHDYQWSQGELVILRKEDHNGAPCCSTLTGHSNPLIQR